MNDLAVEMNMPGDDLSQLQIQIQIYNTVIRMVLFLPLVQFRYKLRTSGHPTVLKNLMGTNPVAVAEVLPETKVVEVGTNVTTSSGSHGMG